jgi:shikimate kinase
MQFIFLIGPPGAGKTVCAAALAQRLHCAFYDTDTLIETEVGLSISQLFEQHGESYFRKQETQLLAKLPERFKGAGACVFATGGGLPVYNDNLARLAQLGKVVALTAPLSVLVDRVSGNAARPLLASKGQEDDSLLSQRLSQLIEQRRAVYDKAGYKIDTSGLKPDQVAEKIIEDLGLRVGG